uniref:Uncharacterized protein n=1 Tax=Oryza sativa subsp. japonica TaxID=39947 RepID=Q8LNX0_ORYSJ|nr:hypothetical protein [Oryza sativa Japonica Group]
MADLYQSSSDAAALKKLHTEEAVPPKQIMAREAGGLHRGSAFLRPFPLFYELRWMEPNRVSGCCGFRLRDGMKAKYIPLQCHSSRSQWRSRWFYLEIKELDPVLVVPEVQPERSEDWTSKPPITPSLQAFVDAVFLVMQRVKEVLISAASTADEPPAPLCDKLAAEKAAAINALPLTDVVGLLVDHQAFASLKDKVADEVANISSVPAVAGGSGTKRKPWARSSAPSSSRQKFAGSEDLGSLAPPLKRRVLKLPAGKKALAVSVQSGSETAMSGSPAAIIPRVEVAPVVVESVGPTTAPVAASPPGVANWSDIVAECHRLLESTSRAVGAQMDHVVARGTAADGRVVQLEAQLEVAHEDLQKMKEIVAGNEMQRQGLEKKMNDTHDILFSLRDSLRRSFTSLHQLALSCGMESSIPTHPDETSLTSALSELAGEMEAIPSRHAAHVAEEISNGIHTGACYVLACVKLALPGVDLKEILSKGAVDATRENVMSSVSDLGESILPFTRSKLSPSCIVIFVQTLLLSYGQSDFLYFAPFVDLPRFFVFRSCVDSEDVQQGGCPDVARIDLPSSSDAPAPAIVNDGEHPLHPLPFVDLDDVLAERDRRIAYWRTKFEVAELERSLVVVKKDQAVEALRGCEVWLNSYLKSCYSAMADVCRQLKVNRAEPEESTAGYLSWMRGACAQLEGIGQQIDISL